MVFYGLILAAIGYINGSCDTSTIYGAFSDFLSFG